MNQRGGRARAVLTTIAATVTALAARRGEAFCRTTTVEQPPSFNPVKEGGCWNQGKPLFWLSQCVGYNIQQDASRKVSYEEASNLIATAFTRWTGATCPTTGAGRSRVSIDVRDLGPIPCRNIGYEGGKPNQNIIVFRDEKWPYDPSVLGLTKVQYDVTTGQIYGADMEINMVDMNPVALRDPVPEDAYDFLAVVTHEAGHFLGIAHSDTAEATMFAEYRRGSFATRILTDDDVAGICEVYRTNGARPVLDDKVTEGTSCDPTPRGGLARECEDEAGGCSVAAVALLGGSTAGVMGLGVGLVALGRRLARPR